MINSLLNTQLNLKQNLYSIKGNFWQFIFLMIVINILLLLSAMPIYVGVFLILLKSYLLGILSLMVSFILIIFISIYLIFSPLILLENNLKWHKAIVKSSSLSQGYFNILFLNIAVLIAILAAMNYLSLYLTTLGILGLILGSIFTVIMIIFGFSFLMSLYTQIKSARNYINLK